MPPRRRTITHRRPRVAGLTTPTHRTDEARQADSALTVESPPARRRVDRPEWAVPRPAERGPTGKGPTEEGPAEKGPAEEPPGTSPAPDAAADTGTGGEPDTVALAVGGGPEPVDAEAVGEDAAGVDAALPPRTGARRGRAVPLLAAALVVLTGLAVLFGVLDAEKRGTPAATNTALVDVGATSEVAGQLGDALETIYSYDFARLDENERAAREVITPAFAQEFDALWAQVRELAPAQQAVVSATVRQAAVRSIEGDRAEVLVFMDQQATRAAQGDQAGQLSSEGRLTVTGELVDGHWRIANVESR